MIAPDSPIAAATQGLPPNVGPDPKNVADISALLLGQPPVRQAVDPYEDDQALLKLFKDFRKQSFEGRWVYERNWWRNLLYVLGRQWIFYNVQRGAWQDKRMQKWIPRPVTNKMAETVDAMRSVFQSVALEVKCRPVSADPLDAITASTSEEMHPMMREEHDMNFRMFEADFWNITTGNVFIHPWWDRRAEHGMVLVPFEKCLACQTVSPPAAILDAGQKCPSCGAQAFEQAVDQTGQPVGQEYPIGRGCTDVCSPFEIGFPNGYGSFDDLPGIIRQRWRTKAWYEKNEPELVNQLRFEKQASDRSLQMLKAIASQSDISGTALGAQVSDSMQPDGIAELELWLKPTPTYPRGLLLRVAGGEGTEKVIRSKTEIGVPGPLPMVTSKGQPVFNWLHMGYARFGGRIWARSPLDLIIQKQDQINQLDSLMLLGVQRMSNPIWIEPKGAEVKKFTGEPGLVVKYNPLVGGGAKPERIEGANIPQTLIALREQYVADLENLAGTNDVLKGEKPAGVEAFSAMQLLVERAQSRFGPVLNERGELYRSWFQLALELERQYGPVERVWSAMGPNRQWAFKYFKNADIQGAIKVLMEDGSQAPKTNLGKRAAIEGLNQLGFINVQDPDLRMRVFQVFGQTDMLPKLDSDVQSALAEQAAFLEWAKSPASVPKPALAPATPAAAPGQQPARAYFDEGEGGPPATGDAGGVEPGGQPPAPAGPQLTMQPIVPSPLVLKPWHDDIVHISEHRKFANSDAGRMLFNQRPDVEQAFAIHLMEHEQRLAQVQMAQAMMQGGGAPGGPGQKEPGGGGRAMRNSNEQSGKRGASLPPPA